MSQALFSENILKCYLLVSKCCMLKVNVSLIILCVSDVISDVILIVSVFVSG